MRFQSLAALIFIGLLAETPVWSRKPGDPFKPGSNSYSRAQDIQIGQIQAAQIKLRYPEVRDEFLETYLRRVGDRLASTPEARQSEFPFSFTLLNVPMVNAFALPGGPMFVFTGLMKATDNEAQLAGVMAHEMSHVILRHGTHELTKARTTTRVAAIVSALGSAALGNQAGLAQLTRMGLGLGENSLILHFSREAESEADLLGAHLMAESGYNPMEMARFFQKLGSMGTSGSQFFSDHPNPDNRERAIETEIGGLPVRQYGYETGDFDPAKLAVNALPPAGPATAGGAVPQRPLPPSIQPSAEWRQARANSFLVNFPANWQAFGNSASDSVMLAPSGGAAKTPNGAIDLSIGVLLSYFKPEKKDIGLGIATLSLVAELNSHDPSIQLASTQQRSVMVDGSQGLVSLLKANSPSLGPETNVLLTVSRPEGVFYALSIAPVQSFPQLQRTFDQILNSIRFSKPVPNPAPGEAASPTTH